MPIVLSILALGTVIARLVIFGAAPAKDEGAAAHIFQLLVVGQFPLLAYFAFRYIPREPRDAVTVLALQACALLIALAPVRLLNW